MRVLAVDLGATSVRVVAVDIDAPQPTLQVLHRWQNGPVRDGDGSLRWDWPRILLEVRRGLEAGLKAGPAASIGVDGWAVDYGLLDRYGRLLEPPYSYRDDRTARWHSIAQRIGVDRLYRITGVQQMAINTVFQVALHDRDQLRKAAKLLLLPDLLVRELTGFEGAERSNASTTALLDARSGDWASEITAEIGLTEGILPEVIPAGLAVGSWHGVPVHSVGSHDTASAFVGVPVTPSARTAIVSSGTWFLVGVERPTLDLSEESRVANFSNERAALGGFRFLKNVAGFWMLERCRAQWGGPPIMELVNAAAQVIRPVSLVDVMDPRFSAPIDMETEIRVAARLGGGASRAEIVRCIMESIAAAAARVVRELGPIVGAPIEELLVVGGGARVSLMNDLLRRHTGLRVTVGSPEASALGNALVQGIALGRFKGLDEARQWAAFIEESPGVASVMRRR